MPDPESQKGLYTALVRCWFKDTKDTTQKRLTANRCADWISARCAEKLAVGLALVTTMTASHIAADLCAVFKKASGDTDAIPQEQRTWPIRMQTAPSVSA